MASSQCKQRHLHKLKNDLEVRMSLMDQQVQELLNNVHSYHNEVRNSVGQLMSSNAPDHMDVQKHRSLMKTLNKKTQVIMNLNSAFLDLLDADDSGEDNAIDQGNAASAPSSAPPFLDLPVSTTREVDAQPQFGYAGSQEVQPAVAPVKLESIEVAGCPPPVAPMIFYHQPMVSAAMNLASCPSYLSARSASNLPSSTASSLAPPLHLFTMQPADMRSDLCQSSLTAWPSSVSTTEISSFCSQPVKLSNPPVLTPTATPVLPSPLVQPKAVLVTQLPARAQELPSCTVSSIQPPAEGRGSVVGDVVMVSTETKKHHLGQDRLAPHDLVSVAVSHVENPSSFYVVKCRTTVEQLTEQINHFVTETSEIQPFVSVDALGLAQFTDYVFYRARVVNILDETRALVYFIDFGNYHKVQRNKFLILPSKFQELPALAVHCCLSGVISSSKTGMWTEKAINRFQTLVNGSDLVCKVVWQPETTSVLPTLVELFKPAVSKTPSGKTQTETTVSNISIAQCLLRLKLANPIGCEELVARLRASQSHTSSAPETPSTQNAVTDSGQGTYCDSKLDSFTQNQTLAGKHLSETSLQQIPSLPEKLIQQCMHSPDVKKSYSRLTSGIPKKADVIEGEAFKKSAEDVTMYKNLIRNILNTNDYFTIKVMVAAVSSPSDFYVHMVSEVTGTLLQNMMSDLNKKFEQTTKAILRQQSQKFVAKPGKLCCAQFKDGSYYRGLVLDIKICPGKKEKKVQVFYIDFGEKDWLSSSLVYPLPSDFCHISPQAVWCSLAYVRPLNNSDRSSSSDDSLMSWQPNTLAEFEKLVGPNGEEKILVAFAAGQLPKKTNCADAVQKEPLQIVLIDQQNNNLCINHDLIVRQLATLATPWPENGDSVTEECSGNGSAWQDMANDASSLRNTYQVDIDDAGVALTGVKSQGRPTGVCRFYNSPATCWKGEKCPYLHVEPGMQKGASGNLKKVSVFDEDQSELLPTEGSLVTVEVSCIRNPSHFYVILPWGPLSIPEVASKSHSVRGFLEQESLEKLNSAMKEFYQHKRLDSDYSLYAPGEAVAAKCQRSSAWLRAKVIDVNPDEESVLVMFVDFGDMEWVSEVSIRQLDDRFLHLPLQAVECCLMGIETHPDHASWPDIAREEFFSLVNGRTLVAHIRQRLWSGRLGVDLYDTSQGNSDINIATVLIQKGLAIKTECRQKSDESNASGQELDSQEAKNEDCYVPG